MERLTNMSEVRMDYQGRGNWRSIVSSNGNSKGVTVQSIVIMVQ